jgi:hypothetical protein
VQKRFDDLAAGKVDGEVVAQELRTAEERLQVVNVQLTRLRSQENSFEKTLRHSQE